MAAELATLSTAAAVRLLQQCSAHRDLSLGRAIHKMLLAKPNRQGLEDRSSATLSPLVANRLIDMYAKCGCVEEGRLVLESMAMPDVVSWTSLIWGYSQRGQFDQAMAMLATMQQDGVRPNSFTFGSILKACMDVETGASIHRLLLVQARHLCDDVYVATALVSMYGAGGSISLAKDVFDAVSSDTRNIVTWSAMLCAYATAATAGQRHRGDDQTQLSSSPPFAAGSSSPLPFSSSSGAAREWRRRGMEHFHSFLNDGRLRMDQVMAIAILALCDDLTQGCFCHRCVLEAGFAADPALCHALIVMYGRCGSSELAWKVFSGMVRKDVVSWTSMIKAADASDCPLLFRTMLLEGVVPNELTLAEALHSCSLAPEVPATIALGKCIHACARELGYETDVVVGTSLINMYAKCAALAQAEAMFQCLARIARTNCVCWTAMITANAKAGEWKKAVTLYRQMQLQGIAPNRVSFIAVLSACSTSECLATGKLVHACIEERGLEGDTMVANAVVTMYGKCGSIEDARKVFERMARARRDSVSWSAMLAAIAQAGELDSRSRNEQAFLLFAKMQLEGVTPTKVTLVSLLDCCSDLNAGRLIHSRLLLQCSSEVNELDTALWNAVVDMYARCGSLDSAAREFHQSRTRDFVSWNGMITASAQHSRWSDAVVYFREMQQEGVDPDEVTMVTLLFACDHGGFVEQGCDYFTSMSRDYGLSPRLEHSACVLDMLGRAGHVQVAQNILQASACSDPVLWTSLLGACSVHGDVDGANTASEQILDANPDSSSAYVVLCQAQLKRS